MGPRRRRDQRLGRSPDGIKHFGFECAHDNKVLHLVVGCCVALGIKPRANTTTGGWSPIRAAPKALTSIDSVKFLDSVGPVGRLRPAESPTATIVVTGRGAAPHLLDCLRSISLIESTVAVEVIVTLNEPTSDLLAGLAAGPVEARVITSRVDLGVGGASNAAVRLAKGRHIILLSDKTRVDRRWLAELVGTAE